jgi:hypothetical protein
MAARVVACSCATVSEVARPWTSGLTGDCHRLATRSRPTGVTSSSSTATTRRGRRRRAGAAAERVATCPGRSQRSALLSLRAARGVMCATVGGLRAAGAAVPWRPYEPAAVGQARGLSC